MESRINLSSSLTFPESLFVQLKEAALAQRIELVAHGQWVVGPNPIWVREAYTHNCYCSPEKIQDQECAQKISPVRVSNSFTLNTNQIFLFVIVEANVVVYSLERC